VTAEQTLTILDVGHGNSAVLADAEGVAVIDAGPKAGLLQYLSDSPYAAHSVGCLTDASF
jgi:hypothetical protein